ncbi:hypothetical protein OG802_33390 [Streptomyces sp. NBC_00704]|uniref:hypothetical protein n=1 Tax=Streptomyces sp. NBC_00704 TaxID=2975809 RepID=UPI002E336D55|nr:hypothetical protein [Streptomyces sp. NBC_00704]
MLIRLQRVVRYPGTPLLAAVRTSFGHIAVRWCGDRAAEPGEYDVEWAIDEVIVWGRNARPAAGVGPGLRTGGHCVVLRGRLGLTEDGVALLDLDGTNIPLNPADPPPADAVGTWVELFVDRHEVSLRPRVP